MLLTLSFAIKLSMKFAKPGINKSIGYAVGSVIGNALAMLALTIKDAMVWFWISMPWP